MDGDLFILQPSFTLDASYTLHFILRQQPCHMLSACREFLWKHLDCLIFVYIVFINKRTVSIFL